LCGSRRRCGALRRIEVKNVAQDDILRYTRAGNWRLAQLLPPSVFVKQKGNH